MSEGGSLGRAVGSQLRSTSGISCRATIPTIRLPSSSQRAQLRALLDEASQPVFNTVAVVAGSLLLGYLIPTGGDVTRPIRIAAGLLQLIGAIAVVQKIRERLRMRDRPGWFRRFINALKAPLNRTLRVESAVATMAGGSVGAAIGASAGATVEQRLAVAEQNITLLRERLRNAEERFQSDLAAVRRSLSQESDTRSAAISELRRQSEELESSDIAIDMKGFVLIIIGIVLGAVPDLFAAAFAWGRW